MQGTSPRDWAYLPAVAIQAISQHCSPAGRARLRLTCLSWHQALATQFSTLSIGPGDPCLQQASTQHAHQPGRLQAWALGDHLHRAFPAVASLKLTASSSREYEQPFTQDLARLLASQPRLTRLILYEVHELEELDTLDPASLWDVLHAALPVVAARLQVLCVAGCFWNQPELFGGLRQLTALTELRLADTPLETAYELQVVASLTHLVHLEFGIIFDGSSAHHDVPRALESIGNLQRLQALSIPMWRRSLGGRAHPLAPALSAALQRLTGLTNLAVDGKFSQLGVVSLLTNLRQLASAAPLSKEGWQAICQLSNLTLLTSLTPALDALQLNPRRPHPGCDLAQLAPKASLVGIDVAVLAPEHLAPMGQLTALQQLNLRCASMFQQPKQQAQVLVAMACLPPGLTSLSMGPLLPLSPQLLSSIASSCPRLKSLQASFTHTVPTGAAVTPAAAAAGGGFNNAWPPPQQQAPNGHWLSGSGAAGPGSVPSLTPADHLGPIIDSMEIEQEQPGDVGCSVTISQALSRFQQLHLLELVLLSHAERCESPTLASAAAARRSSSYGGGVSSPPPAAAPLAAAAAGPAPAPAAATSSSRPWLGRIGGDGLVGGSSGGESGHAAAGGPVPLQLQELPSSLRHLRLSGSWLLCQQQGAHRTPSAAGGFTALGSVPSSPSLSPTAFDGNAMGLQPDQQQQQQQGLEGLEPVCQVCKGKSKAAPAAQATPGSDPAGSTAASLCECLQGLRVSRPLVEGPVAASMQGEVAQLQPQNSPQKLPAASPHRQQQQQEQGQQAALGLSAALATRGRSFERSPSNSSRSGSPSKSVLLGLKRPASYPSVQQLPATAAAPAAAAAAAAAASTSAVDMPADSAGASPTGAERQDELDSVFVYEQQQVLQKRSRSLSSIQHPTGTLLQGYHPSQGSPQGAAAAADQQQQQLPQLVELCLFRCQVSYEALSALVTSSGTCLSKLQLLQLSVTDPEPQSEVEDAAVEPAQQQQNRRPPLPHLQQQPKQQQQRLPVHVLHGYGWPGCSHLSADQLLRLPVAWSCLQELHIHPYHLWGMLSAGCMTHRDDNTASTAQGSSSRAAAARLDIGSSRTAVDSSSQELMRPAAASSSTAHPLQHVSQLLNLRHLYVVNSPTSFVGATPPADVTPPGLLARIPGVHLPVHDREALAGLLSALQAGLQQLPALRQLLLYLGPVTVDLRAGPHRGVSAAAVAAAVAAASMSEDLWMQAGESLLYALPAVRVRHFSPSMHNFAAAAGEAFGVQLVTLPEGQGSASGTADAPLVAAAGADAVAVSSPAGKTGSATGTPEAAAAAAAAGTGGGGGGGAAAAGSGASAAPACAGAPQESSGAQAVTASASRGWPEPEYMI